MELQHQVVLALGSNQGDRFARIAEAIIAIHQRIGTVVKTSRLYESESWGFSSEPFYNCAILMHTLLEAPKVLEAILAIETQLGRIRTDDSGYQPRTIDIDIITFDRGVISTDTLQVPHPLLQDRKFVLLPMKDLGIPWEHPLIGKSLAQLLADTNDTTQCVPVKDLEQPLAGMQLNSVNHIAIEGNIGAGKTTLTRRIAEDFNAKIVLERFADNPFLPKFYEDQGRYAFPLEMSFLADRFQQIADDLSQFDLFRDFIISDYHLFKSLIFAKVTLVDEEFRLYRKLFDIIYREVPKPDLYVFLYQDKPRLLENIRKRGREYEQQIPSEYLENINKGYLEYIRSLPETNVLVIDMSARDFVNVQADYLFVLEEINNKVASFTV